MESDIARYFPGAVCREWGSRQILDSPKTLPNNSYLWWLMTGMWQFGVTDRRLAGGDRPSRMGSEVPLRAL